MRVQISTYSKSLQVGGETVNIGVIFKVVCDLRMDCSGCEADKEGSILLEFLASFFHVEGAKIIHGAVGERR